MNFMKTMAVAVLTMISFWIFLVVVVCALAGCTSGVPIPSDTVTSTSTSTSVATDTKIDCGVVTEVLKLKNQTVALPASGRFVLESHLVTKEDPAGYPPTVTTNIQQHLDRACAKLQKYDARPSCSDVFTLVYHKQWTPAEKGKIGQGSIGETRPTAEQEMWGFNMYWTAENKPKPGTKYLFSYNGVNVVGAGGFETGPMSAEFLGGVQGEMHWALKADSMSKIRVGRLVDQSVPYGPAVCR